MIASSVWLCSSSLAGENEEVIAELGILKVNLQQFVVLDRQHLTGVDALYRRRSSIVRCQEAKLSHQTSRQNFDAESVTRNFPLIVKNISLAASPLPNNLSPLPYLRSVINGFSHSIDLSPFVAFRAILTSLRI